MIKEYTVTNIRNNPHMGIEYMDGNTIFLFNCVNAEIGDKVKVQTHSYTHTTMKVWVNGVEKWVNENPMIPSYMTKEQFYAGL